MAEAAPCASFCRSCEGEKNNCTSCGKGYYLSGSDCLQCPAKCFECLDGRNCTVGKCRSDEVYNDVTGQCNAKVPNNRVIPSRLGGNESTYESEQKEK